MLFQWCLVESKAKQETGKYSLGKYTCEVFSCANESRPQMSNFGRNTYQNTREVFCLI